MTEVQITIVLVILVCAVIALRAFRRIRAVKREEELFYKTEPEKGVSYDTGRDESQWRRAYSHR